MLVLADRLFIISRPKMPAEPVSYARMILDVDGRVSAVCARHVLVCRGKARQHPAARGMRFGLDVH
jgi:hypothetical protein